MITDTVLLNKLLCIYFIYIVIEQNNINLICMDVKFIRTIIVDSCSSLITEIKKRSVLIKSKESNYLLLNNNNSFLNSSYKVLLLFQKIYPKSGSTAISISKINIKYELKYPQKTFSKINKWSKAPVTLTFAWIWQITSKTKLHGYQHKIKMSKI